MKTILQTLLLIVLLLGVPNFTLVGFQSDYESKLTKAQKDSGNIALGYLTITTEKVQIYDHTNKPISGKEYKIEKAEIRIKEGFISDIRIYVNGNQYINSKAPINLMKFGKRIGDKLYSLNGKKNEKNYIFIFPAVRYEASIKNKFVPDDYVNDNLIPGEINIIKKDKNLEAVVDFRIYSDFLGVINEEENGILQLESKAKIFLGTSNIKNADLIPLKYIEPYMSLVRFDQSTNKVALIQEVNQTNFRVSEPMDLLEKSFLSVGGHINILSYGLMNDHFSFNVNTGMGVNLSRTITPTDNRVLDFNTFQGMAEMGIEARRFENFGLDFRMTGIWLNPLSVDEISDFEAFWILKTSAEINGYIAKDIRKSVFLRFNYFDNLASSGGSFYQLQVGYKAPLNFGSVKAPKSITNEQ
ncbi:hypothetical protein [Roseivirga sp. E12]|uniref:hypothetical protein n=1 Tax=Roseivirga sp. E12 TaxID=2819237 RepID=UPI001ABD24F0|nr:hypothetical protein [Roseivirga sp. E12]MBO3699622.1 hypothetical protein [Roseivirga sp. E12]